MAAAKTTTEIRKAAKELMTRVMRPVSVLEIQTFIAREMPLLNAKICAKSIDYVRVTLATTPKGAFVKFGCPEEIKLSAGESQKKLFWGVGGVQYDGIWCLVGGSAGKGPRGNRRREEGLPQADLEGTEGESSAWEAPVTLEAAPVRSECVVSSQRAEEALPLLAETREFSWESDWSSQLGVDLFDPWSPGFYAWEY
jgi:hypothetical protein